MKFLSDKKLGFTLMEIAVALLIIAILVGVTIPVVRRQLQKNDEYSYYLAYKTVEKLGGQIAALGDPGYGGTAFLEDPNYEVKISSANSKKYKRLNFSKVFNNIITSKLYSNFVKTEKKIFRTLFPKVYADNSNSNSNVVRIDAIPIVDASDLMFVYELYGVCGHTPMAKIAKRKGNAHDTETDVNGNTRYLYKTKADFMNCALKEVDDKGNQISTITINKDTIKEYFIYPWLEAAGFVPTAKMCGYSAGHEMSNTEYNYCVDHTLKNIKNEIAEGILTYMDNKVTYTFGESDTDRLGNLSAQDIRLYLGNFHNYYDARPGMGDDGAGHFHSSYLNGKHPLVNIISDSEENSPYYENDDGIKILPRQDETPNTLLYFFHYYRGRFEDDVLGFSFPGDHDNRTKEWLLRGGKLCAKYEPNQCGNNENCAKVHVSCDQGKDGHEAKNKFCLFSGDDHDIDYTLKVFKQVPVGYDTTVDESVGVCTPISTNMCTDDKGYYNMETKGWNDVEKPCQNQCVCTAGYVQSENDSKVCCAPPNDNGDPLYHTENGNCTACAFGFNPSLKECCPDHSTYNADEGKCVCNPSYEEDTTNGSCVKSNKCPMGMEFDNKLRVCVPAPPLISAQRFCNLIADNWNISSSKCDAFTAKNGANYYEALYTAVNQKNVLNSIYTDNDVAKGAFNRITPNIVFSNGLRLWILGDRAASIPGLSYDSTNAHETQNMCIDKGNTIRTKTACDNSGGTFCANEYHCMALAGTSSLKESEDKIDARNCCSAPVSVSADADPRTMALSGFTVYVDINGTQGDGTLWKDVFPFYVTTTGRVFPAYPLDAAEMHKGGNNSAYLPTDIYYFKSETDKRKRVLAFTSISYADAVCKAGIVNPYSPYCYNLGTTASGNNPCQGMGLSGKNKCFVTVRRKSKLL